MNHPGSMEGRKAGVKVSTLKGIPNETHSYRHPSHFCPGPAPKFREIPDLFSAIAEPEVANRNKHQVIFLNFGIPPAV
jgi:hypothetical protein